MIHPPHHRVRVTLAHECELVQRGLAEMLAPYAARVALVASDPDGGAAADADLTLHDFASGLHLLPGPGLLAPVRHSGRLVAYTWHPRPDLVAQALAAGLAGVLSKSLGSADLVAALEALHRGDRVVQYGMRLHRPEAGDVARRGLLTAREEEVVRLITQGLDNVSIAREVTLSINSVKSHIRSAYRKMGVASRSQAVLWGVRHGYLGPVPDSAPVPTDASA